MSITTDLPADIVDVEVPAYTEVYVRMQAAGPRKFNVRGPKADIIRRAALVGGYTRKQMAELAGASVSRVAEVLWGLDHDGITYDVAKTSTKSTTPSPARVDADILADAAE